MKTRIFAYEIDDSRRKRRLFSVLPPNEMKRGVGLPSEAVLGEAANPENVLDERFIPNPIFPKFMNHVIAKHGPRDPALCAEAERQGAGWVYIVDGRAPSNEHVEPEDIIGAFEVRDGRVFAYQAMPSHKLVSKRGFFALPTALHDALLRELVTLVQREDWVQGPS